MSQDAAVFTITRDYAAPLSAVWRAWSEPERLRQWWGPKGCRVEILRFEFRPGGFFHYAMRYEGAPTMWGRFNFRSITPERQLVWLNSFANERCGIARAPFSDDCPLEIENRVVFSGEGARTTVSLAATPFGEIEAERRYFEDLRPSMEQGWGGTLDQLGELLARG